MNSNEENKKFEEDIEESLQELPEAPQSIHVDGYYKGFHAGFTIRKANNDTVAVTSTVNLIDSLITRGFKPSWNDGTNGKHVQPELKNTKLCDVHGVDMSERKSKDGSTFYSHATKMNDGTWIYCSGNGWKNPNKFGPRYLEDPNEIDNQNEGVPTVSGN